VTAPPEAVVEQRVRESGLLAAGRPVVVLLSGGRDSTCLLDLAVVIAGRQSVTALHLNYRLREEADADERHCAELCSRLGVPLEVRRPARPERGNLQAWARDERYGTATQMALARGGDVAAGHTATDQVETILYRLASSPSRRALLGMRPREGLLVRPLLEFTRAQTAAYCAARGLTWREDESNDSDAYARNRIRAQLVPALQGVHPGAVDNVIAVAEILREEAAVLDALVDELLERRDRVRLARLREVEPALARLVVQRLADDAAGGPASGVARRAAEILALDEHGTVQLDPGGGVVAIAEYGVLRFESRASRSSETTPEPVLLAIPGSAVFGEQQITCELGPPAREPGVLDRATLGSDLLVRSWRPGDRMAPLGLHGSKSLQDLFTARRVPRRERGGVPVVESEGEIVWVAGVATSERFKVTDSTAEAVRLSVRPDRPPRS
jgi:tRNA(Ile)-lysidine synthase